jgi:acetoin:2,6-dichlorophenolindophenol oxidoreductase subunit beta
MGDTGFDELDAPIIRVGAPFMPSPFSSALEQQYVPSSARVVEAVRRTLA